MHPISAAHPRYPLFTRVGLHPLGMKLQATGLMLKHHLTHVLYLKKREKKHEKCSVKQTIAIILYSSK